MECGIPGCYCNKINLNEFAFSSAFLETTATPYEGTFKQIAIESTTDADHLSMVD